MIIQLDEYQKEAIKTFKPMELMEARKYMSMKICEEAAEVSSLISKHYYHDKPLDETKIKDELGDVLWYVANMAQVNGFTLAEVATHNIEKLRARHGESYNKNFYTN